MVVKIPKPKINTERIVNYVLEKPSARVLQKIGRTKRFTATLLEGASVTEAKVKAGYAITTPSKAILTQPAAQMVMQRMVDGAFPNRKVVKKLKQLWDASDRRATKDGDIYETPNWNAQLSAFDRVSQIRKLVPKDDESKQPQGITIQIVGEGNVHLKDMSVP